MLKENCQKKQTLPGTPLTAEELFGVSPPETIRKLSEIKKEKCFPKAVFVYRTGDNPRGVYILLQGRAQLCHTTESGEKKIIRSIEPNEIIGFTETLADAASQTDIETLTPCVFEYIESADFLNFLREEPDTCFRLVQFLADNLQKTFRNYAAL